MYTQSDPGSENFGVANMHTLIRQFLDRALLRTIQHKWQRKHQNIKPEILWSGLRRTFTPGFENLFIEGDRQGFYDNWSWLQTYDYFLHELLVRRLTTNGQIGISMDCYSMVSRPPESVDGAFQQVDPPRMQIESTSARSTTGSHIPASALAWSTRLKGKRYEVAYSRRLVTNAPSLPLPLPLYQLPIARDAPILDEVEKRYAPPEDPVFQLVPPIFDTHARDAYRKINGPAAIKVDNFWAVIRRMWAVFNNASNDISRHIPDVVEEQPQPPVRLLEGYDEMFAIGALDLPEDPSGESFIIYNGPRGRAQLLSRAERETVEHRNADNLFFGQSNTREDGETTERESVEHGIADNVSIGQSTTRDDDETDIGRLNRMSETELGRQILFDCLVAFSDSEGEDE